MIGIFFIMFVGKVKVQKETGLAKVTSPWIAPQEVVARILDLDHNGVGHNIVP